jgi:hypothetical protein
VYWAVTGLVGVHLLVRSVRPKRRPRDWTQIWTSAFRFNLGVGIVSLGFAVTATIAAVPVSGGDRIRYAVLAGVLYVIGAFFGLGAIGFHRYRSGRPLRRLSWVFHPGEALATTFPPQPSAAERSEPYRHVSEREAVQVPGATVRDLLGLGSQQRGELPLESDPRVVLDD